MKTALGGLLASPDRILAESRRIVVEASQPSAELAAVVVELDEIESSQRRLTQLYTRKNLPVSALDAEARDLADRRRWLEARRRELASGTQVDEAQHTWIEDRLPHALERIQREVSACDEDGFGLMLRAVDARITASTERATIRGTVPITDQTDESFATIARTSA